ncbi:hypothetical protein GWI33_023016 [Rhynchophorus ferrugineus]|uniref:Uncharacterized protein n=1 Tax=Rhynchophorus ferrugineus TaxID=354439 RepID=A0A834MM91_RHYFE|nr:hypothetical protein GWI33_023016 [Rhynchophorus ferrugineus]
MTLSRNLRPPSTVAAPGHPPGPRTDPRSPARAPLTSAPVAGPDALFGTAAWKWVRSFGGKSGSAVVDLDAVRHDVINRTRMLDGGIVGENILPKISDCKIIKYLKAQGTDTVTDVDCVACVRERLKEGENQRANVIGGTFFANEMCFVEKVESRVNIFATVIS